MDIVGYTGKAKVNATIRTLGKELKGVRIDLSNGVCYDDRPTPPRWTRAEHDAAAADAEAASDDE